MSKYSVSQWIYGREPVEAGLDRLARYGYDGVELVGEPDAHDQAKLRRMLGERSLVASSVCGLYGPSGTSRTGTTRYGAARWNT
ncbi:MAG: hypothetical protein WKH64_04660 [Chloroflexia bacterium]